MDPSYYVVPDWAAYVGSGVFMFFVPWMCWISRRVIRLDTNYEHTAASLKTLSVIETDVAELKVRVSQLETNLR